MTAAVHHRHSQTVLVGVDNTADCGAAVRWAAAETARRGARLHAVHVVKLVDRYDAGLGADVHLELTHARQTIPSRVADLVFAAAIGDVEVTVSVLYGDATEQLVTQAEDAVLVVLGGADGPEQEVLVSALAAECLCPVVIVAGDGDLDVVQSRSSHSTHRAQGATHADRP